MSVRDVVQAAAGVGGGGEYVEDVFSTYLYDGTGAAKTITNGIDLAGEGGMVWSKVRNNSGTHRLNDSVRGVSNGLRSDSMAADQTVSNGITAFNGDGYTLGTDAGNSGYNFGGGSLYTYASWTFRKSPKFFDVVTYTGDGTTSNQIAHSLDATPGMIVVKRTDSGSNWAVAVYNGSNYDLFPGLNLTDGRLFTSSASYYTSTYFDAYAMFQQFTDVPANDRMNVSGATYVAYLWANNAGGFGDDGEQNVISCGRYTENFGPGVQIELGWEPQWVMVKSIASGGSWQIYDNMRNARQLANTSNGEFSNSQFTFNATGFNVNSLFQDNSENIYIAIRRPMKTPEAATEVFMPLTRNSTVGVNYYTGFPVDLAIYNARTSPGNYFHARLTAANRLQSVNTAAEISGDVVDFTSNVGYQPGTASTTTNALTWNFKRAPGFMDVVGYEGTGVAGATVSHNLNAVPEFMIIKNRDEAGRDWRVYYGNNTRAMSLNRTNPGIHYINISYWNNTSPTSSVFTVGTNSDVNSSTGNHIAYLFATLDGVSKVGSYTGTGSAVNVDCGFSAGARFVLIKREDSTGDWYVWDSTRGIVSGNDPYLLLNSTAAEVTSTDYIDPLASGFTLTSSAPAALNASGGNYIFLAIA